MDLLNAMQAICQLCISK